MGYDGRLVNQIVSQTKNLCESKVVLSVEDHYAGYFDELGLTVNLARSSELQDWKPIASKLLEYLNNQLPKGNDKFCWQLSFMKGEIQVGLFFPGDDIEDNYATHT